MLTRALDAGICDLESGSRVYDENAGNVNIRRPICRISHFCLINKMSISNCAMSSGLQRVTKKKGIWRCERSMKTYFIGALPREYQNFGRVSSFHCSTSSCVKAPRSGGLTRSANHLRNDVPNRIECDRLDHGGHETLNDELLY